MTTQAQAVQAANQVVNLAQLLKNLRQLVETYLDPYNSEGYATLWANFPTAAVNPDGSLGAADATPNPAHPITLSGIGRSCDALTAGVTVLQDFVKFLGNQAVATAQRSQTVDDLVS